MRKITYLLLFLLTSIISHQSLAQKEHKLESYRDKEGNLYWPKSKPVYIFVADNPEGDNKDKLESKSTKQYANPFYFDTEGINYIRTRHAVDPKTKQFVLPKIEIMFEIYADGKPPTTIIELKNSESYTSKQSKQIFYGKDLQIELSARDALSGVKNTYIKVGDRDFEVYTGAINLTEGGAYTVQYYSVDNVGNVEETHLLRSRKFTVDIDPPKTYYNITGISTADSIVSESSHIYFTAEDSSSGVKSIYYKINDGKYQRYIDGNISLEKFKDGPYTIHYYSVDNVNNESKPQSFSFYFDNTAPIMSSDILGDKFIIGNKVYFSGRTKLNLTAVDNRAGVKDIMYSINERAFQKYLKPFYLPNLSGVHTVRFYAIDSIANRKKEDEIDHTINRVYVDLTGPTLDADIEGPTFKVRDTVYISGRTKIRLKAIDKESGLKQITYKLDDDTEEALYEGDLQIDKGGFHRLRYFGYDNVNNRNRGEITFSVDNGGPEIFIHFSIPYIDERDSLKVYPSSLQVYLGASDKKTGAKSISYTINDDPVKRYLGIIEGFEVGKNYVLKITATDKLDNETTEEIEFVIEN